MMENNRISHLLGIERGEVVAVIGAGGKHTLMHRLSEELLQAGEPVVLTSTTNLHRGPNYAAIATLVIDKCGDWKMRLADMVKTQRRVVLVSTEFGPNMYRGVTVDQVANISMLIPDVTLLVKADGARKRLIKAPDEREPVLPPSVDLCVLVLSLAAIGRRLDDQTAHRLERLRTLAQSDPITPQTLTDVIQARGGYAQRLSQAARAALYLSWCNSPEALEHARSICGSTKDDFRIRLSGDTIAGRFFRHSDD